MSLNIKDERTHALVRELALRTGATQTAAVREAVERRLAELEEGETESGAAERHRELLQVVRNFQADLTDPDRERMRRSDEWLYDDEGLPR
jgi:antitoxin VapB